MSLRFTTAGESHGPGLTAIVEGLPAGLELHPGGHRPRPRAAPARPRPRRAHEDREGPRRRDLRACATGARSGSPVALRIENRDYANWEERMNPWPVDAQVDEVHLPRPGPRRPGRRPEVRLHRRAQRARARERPRDRRAGGRRRAWPRSSCGALGVTVFSHVIRSARWRAPAARGPDAGRLRGRRRVAGALPRRRRERTRWWPRSTRPGRPTSRSAACSRCGRSGSSPGLGSHVSWEERLDGRLAQAIMSIQAMKGVGDRRRLRPGRAGSARRPTTRSSGPRSAATSARPTAPAGSRAA